MDGGGYNVTAGPTDCITSLADAHGFFWQTVWDDPHNSELKNLRKDPNVLNEGDQVFIPVKRMKQVDGSTEKRHRFLLRGVPAIVRLRFMNGDKPLKNLDYTLNIDGKLSRGTTDANGSIKISIPPGATQAKLVLGVGDKARKYNIDLGSMDPATTPSGVRKRLQALGFRPGGEDEDPDGQKLQSAIRRFQISQNLKPTGEIDDSLRDMLIKAFGS